MSMAFTDLLTAYLIDPFRIGLLIALVATTGSTAAHTGRAVPLVLGTVFVAVLLATTLGTEGQDRGLAIGVGILANAVILGVILAVLLLWSRFSQSR